MSDQRNQQNQQGGKGGQQQGGSGQQKPGQQQQQQRPNQKHDQAGNEQRDQQKQKGGQSDQQQAHFAPDQISFYDETLKKQIEGSYRTDGNAVYVSSVKYGIKSAPYGHLGTFIDKAGLDLLAQKLLSELARDPAGAFKDLQQQKDDQQRQGESFSVWGQGAVGSNP